MDVESTIQFIIDSQAKTEARAAKHEARMEAMELRIARGEARLEATENRLDRRMDATVKLLQQGTAVSPRDHM